MRIDPDAADVVIETEDYGFRLKKAPPGVSILIVHHDDPGTSCWLVEPGAANAEERVPAPPSSDPELDPPKYTFWALGNLIFCGLTGQEQKFLMATAEDAEGADIIVSGLNGYAAAALMVKDLRAKIKAMTQ